MKYVDKTWSEVRQNGDEVVTRDGRLLFATIKEIFRVKDGQNRPNLMNDPIFFSRSRTFLTKFLNGPIRKIIMLKVKFGDPHEELPHKNSPWLQT